MLYQFQLLRPTKWLREGCESMLRYTKKCAACSRSWNSLSLLQMYSWAISLQIAILWLRSVLCIHTFIYLSYTFCRLRMRIIELAWQTSHEGHVSVERKHSHLWKSGELLTSLHLYVRVRMRKDTWTCALQKCYSEALLWRLFNVFVCLFLIRWILQQSKRLHRLSCCLVFSCLDLIMMNWTQKEKLKCL